MNREDFFITVRIFRLPSAKPVMFYIIDCFQKKKPCDGGNNKINHGGKSKKSIDGKDSKQLNYLVPNHFVMDGNNSVSLLFQKFAFNFPGGNKGINHRSEPECIKHFSVFCRC